MAQLRHDYSAFTQRQTEVLIVGPGSLEQFKRHWQLENMPGVGLADPGAQVAALYEQQIQLIKLGRMPAQFLIDLEGRIRFAYYGQAMWDITDNQTVLALLDDLQSKTTG